MCSWELGVPPHHDLMPQTDSPKKAEWPELNQQELNAWEVELSVFTPYSKPKLANVWSVVSETFWNKGVCSYAILKTDGSKATQWQSGRGPNSLALTFSFYSLEGPKGGCSSLLGTAWKPQPERMKAENSWLLWCLQHIAALFLPWEALCFPQKSLTEVAGFTWITWGPLPRRSV